MSETSQITAPERLWRADEILSKTCPIPAEPGIYGWYFRSVPGGIDASRCIQTEGCVLLYTGISPKRPSGDGRESRQNLRKRVRYHYIGNAEGSTLRKTLGSLLRDDLGIELRRVGTTGTRITFAAGESKLTEWMAENALVCWHVHTRPWELEETLIGSVSLPLNLDQNRHNPNHARVTAVRAEAVARARALPIQSGPLPNEFLKQGDEDRVIRAFCDWLVSQGWENIRREENFVDVVAERGSERLCAEVKGMTSGNKRKNVDILYGQLLRRMSKEDPHMTYAVVVPRASRGVALDMPARVRQMLQIAIFTVDEDGAVERAE